MRRLALGVVPVGVGEAVAADVGLGSTERDQRHAGVAAVGEASAGVRADAGGVLRLEGVDLAAVELERERAREHDVDLLLPLVAVDAAALPGLEQHQVEAEALDAELAPQRDEALAGLEVEGRKGGTGFHGRAGYARGEMLDEADDLYGLPLGEFTAARDALAKRLRGEKRREDADFVKGLKRPSVAAGAINLAVREHGADDLLAAGEELRAAHGALLEGSGDAAAVRDATAREREAVRDLTRLALGDDASAATEEKVRATLHAASVDDEVRELLEAGRLEREAEAGVDAMALMASASGPKKSSGGSAGPKRTAAGKGKGSKASSARGKSSGGTKTSSGAKKSSGPSEAERRREAAAARAREAAEEAVAASEEADAVAERARTALEEVEEEARKARAVVEDLEAQERQARRAVKEAEADAERRRTEARRAVKTAESRA